MSSQRKDRTSTLAELLKDKPKRGRPPHAVSRQNVYVALSDDEKQQMKRLALLLPSGLSRADLPDLAIATLTARLEALHRAVSDRNREIPEGITDLESLYLLWDLAVPVETAERKWTSIRVSPQEVIELGRAHGTLNAVFGANRSETFSLALILLTLFIETQNLPPTTTLAEVRKIILTNYL
ncbi:MAG: hypothetical protein IPM39_12085 [Chloroflexi bacterium]|nr:hypothetical protein [Chloroflexota bacterium]